MVGARAHVRWAGEKARISYLSRVEVSGDELLLEVAEGDAVDDLERVDDVAERFGHLAAVLVTHLRWDTWGIMKREARQKATRSRGGATGAQKGGGERGV